MFVGKPAPGFAAEAVLNGNFQDLCLGEFAGKWLVLFFYPLDFTFVCPTEILAFSDRIDEFRALGAEVVGVSVDSKFTHLAWTEVPRHKGGVQGVRIPLIADLSKQVSSRYGVLGDAGVALRGLFLIDPNGIVQHATVNNLSVGRSVEETLRLLQAFQLTQANGEVCPANWTPGEATIRPDVNDAKAFFARAHAAA
jgi:peroxiredoxin 2/4